MKKLNITKLDNYTRAMYHETMAYAMKEVLIRMERTKIEL